jgi:ribose transport system substrate-binding protein
MKLLRVAACLLAACSLFVAGCSSASGKPRVAFVSNNNAPFWKICEAGAKKAADEAGVELIYRMPDKGDVGAQKELVDSVLNRGVQAISISVIDPRNQRDYLNEVAGRAALLAVDNDAPESKRLAYIGTDNYAAGRAVGKLVKEALGPDGGTVVIFVGDTAPLNARQRRQGVIDELGDRKAPADLNDFKPSPDGETFGNFKLYSRTFTDQPDGESKCFEHAQTVIEKLGDTKNVCMVGLWAYNPPAILNAVKTKDKAGKIKIVGFDEADGTLDGIRDGHIYATVVQDPYRFGYDSVKLMAALAKGDKSALPKDGLEHVPHRVLMKKAAEKDGMKRLDVEEFRKELNQRRGR